MQKAQNISNVNIIYATESGTSYDLAKQFILTQGLQLAITTFTNIADITTQSFRSTTNNDSMWVFFISTTGQGDFPYSMRTLWKKLLNKYHERLNGMRFSIFALGDRSYGDNFCMAARKFRQRLIGLGAHEAVDIGLGDQQDPNGYFTQYRQSWLPKLKQYLMNNNYLTQLHQQPKHHTNIPQISLTIKKSSLSINNNNNNLFDMKLLQREQICPNKDRRVFTTTFQIINYHDEIKLGDVLDVYPHNCPQDINWLMTYFGLKQHDMLQEGGILFTYKDIFASQINVSSTLNHSFFISRPDLPPLHTYTQNSLYKEKLTELETDYDEYHNYIRKYKRNVIEVLKDFQIKDIPVREFVLRCGQIFPRKYSIAKVVSQQKKIVNILFKLVKSRINQVRIHHGLCSHDLGLWTEIGGIRKGNIVKGEFEYNNQKPSSHFIFMTLGTGVAPFMQYFNHALKNKEEWNFTLFFTNRFHNETYFQQQLQQLTLSNQLNPFLSFTGQGGKRIIRLVQDNCHHIQQIIHQNGVQNVKFMICGPKQVCQGLQNILSRELSIDIKALKKRRIFLYENW